MKKKKKAPSYKDRYNRTVTLSFGWKHLAFLGAFIALMVFLNQPQDAVFPSKYKITNVHEHIQSTAEVPKTLAAMDETGIKQTILVGSPVQTLSTKAEPGFSLYDQNNSQVLMIQERNPDRFIAFCTINPLDPKNREKAEKCLDEGAKGFKLYAGHGTFHTVPLDDERLIPFYELAEERGVPLLFHVNSGKYIDEFESVLKQFPKLNIICPHFCLSTRALSKLGPRLDKYPNLYLDVSFGAPSIFRDGVGRISERIDTYRDFIIKYSDRFFYGTDFVITSHAVKTKENFKTYIMAYRDLLEKDTFVYHPKGRKEPIVYNGLNLPDDVLKKIYEDNIKKLIK